jgi:hypothetical protein
VSASLNVYVRAAAQARELCDIATSTSRTARFEDRRQTLYHASLAAHVAGWQGYVEGVCQEAVGEMSVAGDARLVHLHSLSSAWFDVSLKRFNTPSWENSRDLILRATGFDPISSWTWPARNRSAQWVRQRWAEVLRVRHAFAHGAALPAYSWTQTQGGKVRLAKGGVETAFRLFENLVRRTDHDLGGFVRALFGTARNW